MGIIDTLKKLGGKGNANREMISDMANQIRMERIANERQLSPNERELNRLRNESREEAIKEQLEVTRKARQDDIDFGHNPINTKNIMKAQWEVMKEKNMFNKKSNVFHSDNSVLHSDNKVMRSDGNVLKNNDNLMKGGNMFKI